MQLVSGRFDLFPVRGVHHVPETSTRKDKDVQRRRVNMTAMIAFSFLSRTNGEPRHLHYSVDSSAVSLPHAPEARLPSYIPDLHDRRSTNKTRQQLFSEMPAFCTDALLCVCARDTFIVTLPLVTFLMLKPTVGIMSSLNCPDCAHTHTITQKTRIKERTRRKGRYLKCKYIIHTRDRFIYSFF